MSKDITQPENEITNKKDTTDETVESPVQENKAPTEEELKEKYLSKNISYTLNPMELSFMQSIFGQSMRKNGFRNGKLPAQLAGYYMSKDPKIMNFIVEIHKQQALEELKNDKKTLHFIKLINQQYTKDGSIIMSYELFFLEGITEEPKTETTSESSETPESSENPENNSKKTEKPSKSKSKKSKEESTVESTVNSEEPNVKTEESQENN